MSLPIPTRWYELFANRAKPLRGPWVRRALLCAAIIVVAGYFLRDTILGTPTAVMPAWIVEATRGARSRPIAVAPYITICGRCFSMSVLSTRA